MSVIRRTFRRTAKLALAASFVAGALFWIHHVPATEAQTLEATVDDSADNPSRESTRPRFNVPIKTAGGQQFWTDVRNRDGVRMQQNALTGHYRVLDAKNVRRGWGTLQECTTLLDQMTALAKSSVKPTDAAAVAESRPTVVLVHGLFRTHHSMDKMEKFLHENLDAKSISFAYASTRSSIADQAAALRGVLEDQPADTTFQFVGHSMGNIVVRHLIGDLNRDGDPAGLLPRMKAMVMLGPPNNGATIARRLAKTGLFGLVTGKGGMELGPDNDDLQSRLATPAFPFAIIAGDVSDQLIQNPLTEGSGDFVVGIEEAKLDGAKAFKTVPRLHSFLMDDDECQAFTSEFLAKFAK